MSTLPICIRDTAGVRELDRVAIQDCGIPGYTLMTRAGQCALADLREHWPQATRLLIVCGGGNNGGDGYVLARMAGEQNFEVTVAATGDVGKLSGDAGCAYRDFVATGKSPADWSESLIESADIVIDAVLGTGLERPLRDDIAAVINAINAADCPVFAIDVPSGLNANTGEAMGTAIRADITTTFVGLKQGFYLGHGVDYTGTVLFHDLEIPDDVGAAVPCTMRRIDDQVIGEALPPRRRTSHKGESGHVLLIGGGNGMAGAILLAGEAALQAGAGLVTVATIPEHVELIVGSRPEIMCRGIVDAAELEELFTRADIVAIGPGLGQTNWGRQVFEATMGWTGPKIIDADGLNLLSQAPQSQDDWILTPHPGEAARLLGVTTGEIQQNRLQSVQDLVGRYRGIAVLKGAGTLVAEGGESPWVCDRGNPGMATPGMGDVLTGTLAAIVAQCADRILATRAAVLIHAKAGDAAALAGERGTHSGELFPHIRQLVNP